MTEPNETTVVVVVGTTLEPADIARLAGEITAAIGRARKPQAPQPAPSARTPKRPRRSKVKSLEVKQ